MEWKKLKNIVILVLLLVNGFLLVLVVSRRSETLRYEKAALDQAIQVLASNGIQVDAQALPDSNVLSALSAGRDVAAEAQAVAALLGEDVEGVSRGGGLYLYQGKAGSVSLRAGGELSASLSLSDERWLTDDPADHAADLLRQMGLEAELTGLREEENAASVTFRQLWNGAPIFTSQIAFTYQNGRLCEISGSALLSAAFSAEAGTVLTLPTALLRFLDGILSAGDVCSAITGMVPGYRAGQSFSDTTRLSPVWLVSSDTADYYLDAVSGELTRVSE